MHYLIKIERALALCSPQGLIMWYVWFKTEENLWICAGRLKKVLLQRFNHLSTPGWSLNAKQIRIFKWCQDHHMPDKQVKPDQHDKHALYKMWHLAYTDKSVFGQRRLHLAQQDLLDLCRQRNKAPELGLYVLPRKPSKPLSLDNAVFVSKLQRRHLLALWRLTKDDEAYEDFASDPPWWLLVSVRAQHVAGFWLLQGWFLEKQ